MNKILKVLDNKKGGFDSPFYYLMDGLLRLQVLR